jgi:hypothetical protein
MNDDRKPGGNDENEGEGSRSAARRYNAKLRSFIRKKRVEPAARDAEKFVETHPHEAHRAERAAKAGPMPITKRVVTEGRALVNRAVARVKTAIRKRAMR